MNTYIKSIKVICKSLSTTKLFEFCIIIVILINSILIGVESYTADTTIKLIQQIILAIFTIEIALRFIATDSIKSFFTDGWNIFDLTLVIIGYIPETLFANASMMTALRVLRVFRILRLLRASKEIKLIVSINEIINLHVLQSNSFPNFCLFICNCWCLHVPIT